MTTEEKIFGAALGRAAAERPAFLDVACAGQTELRARVEALLDSHDATGFMEGGAAVGPRRDPAEERPSSRGEQAGDRIGRYRLDKRIGEGGFGVVWMAEQIEPVKRSVALKIIKAGMDTREVIARFEAERQALAMMDHPNIAKVFDAGEAETGRPFFVMELVKGIRITRFCDEQGFGTRRRLELFADVCSAVNHAHQKGVIHRDLKPSNILVTLEGDKPVPKVIDFGIAKATQGRLTDQTLSTRFEHFVGTPAYMSPEQTVLNSPDIDTRSDVYGLGILLYELMTGTPPFDTKSLLAGGYEEMCHIIREVEPPKPSTRLRAAVGEERTILGRARGVAPEKLGRVVEPDLDWIVMKAIEKDRSRRYETPNALALDIQRFLSNEPVSAGPPGPVYRFHKYVGRNKAMLRVAAVISVVLVVATAVSTWQAVRAWRKQLEANAQAARAEREEAMAKSATERLRQQLREAAQSDRVTAQHLGGQGRFREALVRLARACEYAPESSAAAEQAVILANTAAFLPPVATLSDSGAAVFDGHFSAEGRRIVTASDDHIVRVWDAVTSQLLAALSGHTERVRSVRFSPDGGRIVSASEDRTARVWDAATGRLLHVFTGHTDAVQTALFSADGSHVVTASVDDTARVWEVTTGGLVATLSGHRADVNTAEFDAMGTRIVTASDDDTACVWDAVNGRLLATLSGHAQSDDTVATLPGNEADVNTAHFSPDGMRIVTSSNDNTGRVWEAASGRHLLTLRGHQNRLRDAEFSPEGTRVVTNSEDRTARVWDAGTGQVTLKLSDHVERLRTAHFSPDGQRIVTASDDKTARVWDTTTGRLLATLSGHQDRIRTARFSPDGARVVTSSDDGSAGVWDLTSSRPAVVLPGHRHRVWDGQFSPDGTRLLTTSHEGTSRGRDGLVGRLPPMLSGPQDRAWSATFSPDNTRVITASDKGAARVWDAATGGPVAARSSPQGGTDLGSSGPDGPASRDDRARVWDASTGQLLATLSSRGVDIHSAQFSPNGQQIVTASNDITGRVWNASTGEVVVMLSGHGLRLRGAEFSPDGGRIVTTSDDLTARVWNSKTGELVQTLSGHTDTLRSAHFSPNGGRIVTAADDKTARIWDAVTGQLSATLSGHGLRLRGAEFSPDGGRVVTWSDDKSARVWDGGTGQPIHTLPGHVGRVRDARFSPDGLRIVTVSDDKTARVWDATAGELIAILPDHDDRVCGGRFSPDGTRLVTSSEDGAARVWEGLGTAGLPPPWFPDLLRVMAAGTLNTSGELGELPASVRVKLRAEVLIAAKDDRTRYGEVARYHLTPGPDKPVRPGATVTCREAADSLISPEATRWQTDRAYALDPAHPLIQIALARFAEEGTQAEFLRAYGLARIATNAPAPTLKRAAALLAVQPGQEAQASMLLERAAASP